MSATNDEKSDVQEHVATKPNRSHIVHGKQALSLPCLARTDKDRQAGAGQGVSVEDAMSMVHISYGMREPLAPLPAGAGPGPGRPLLATVRSHDQFTTAIYSNDDRYRGLRTVVFMNEADMRDRGLGEFDLVDITSISTSTSTSTSRDGSTRSVYGSRAVRYEIPPGCAAGYMPELNVLCGIADYSSQSGQPVTKHLTVEITPSPPREQ